MVDIKIKVSPLYEKVNFSSLKQILHRQIGHQVDFALLIQVLHRQNRQTKSIFHR